MTHNLWAIMSHGDPLLSKTLTLNILHVGPFHIRIVSQIIAVFRGHFRSFVLSFWPVNHNLRDKNLPFSKNKILLFQRRYRNIWGVTHWTISKVGCVFSTVVVSILAHAEFGSHNHQDDAPHFSVSTKNPYISFRYRACSMERIYLDLVFFGSIIHEWS